MRAYSTPMLVSGINTTEERCTTLEALPLTVGPEGAIYSERWLQEMLHHHPTLLPIEAIEAALVPLVPVCLELPMGSLAADNLFLTTDGGIVLVETKLWRNPEARRSVVAQVLEYAKVLASWDYDTLEAAVRAARKQPRLRLFDLVCPEAAPQEEAAFIDTVARNLRLGRALLVIAGDGIQEKAEEIAEFVQRHLSLHFTLALVEISLWREPHSQAVFIQPKIIARTVQVERAVVRLEEGLSLQPLRLEPAPATAKPMTLTAEAYYEGLEEAQPGLPQQLQSFLSDAEALDVYPDIKRNLSLKWRRDDGREVQLGLIDLQGRLFTDVVHQVAQNLGQLELSRAYEASLAHAVPGASIVKKHLVLGGQAMPVRALIEHREAWLAAIGDYIAALRRALEASEVS